jgi:cytochrome c biogenesis protein CcmG/thiol:disulfide interchange protein DsbE
MVRPPMTNTNQARRRAGARARRNRRIAVAGGIVAVGVLLAVVVIGGSNAPSSDEGDVAAGGASPEDVTFAMLDGTTGSLADYQGQPLVVNFFASWCAPCLAEMPGFEQVHQDLDGQVAFLGVNLQDRPADGRRVVEQTGVTYDIARDPDGSLFQRFGAAAMPTTVFIDAQGRVVDVHSGEISAGALADRIDSVLLA